MGNLFNKKAIIQEIDYDEFEDINEDEVWYDKDKNPEIYKGVLRKLTIIIVICLLFMIVEFVGGYIVNSLALMSDACHLLSDLSGFLFSLISIKLAKRKANSKFHFGYHRTEVMGAVGSILLIWGLIVYLLIECYERIKNPPERIEAFEMIIIAVIGVICNIVMAVTLHKTDAISNPHHNCGHDHGHGHGHGHSHSHKHHKHVHTHSNHHHHDHIHKKGSLANSSENIHSHKHSQHSHSHKIETENNNLNDKLLSKNTESKKNSKLNKSKLNLSFANVEDNYNIKAATIHIIGDLIQSIGVLIAAIIIYFKPTWVILDPICTIVFSIIVIFTTTNVITDCIKTIMNVTPKNLNLDLFQKRLLKIKGIVEIHHLHVWEVTYGKPVMSAHIIIENPEENLKILKKATLVVRKFGIYHSTIQIENKSDSELILNCTNNIRD